MDLTDIDRDVRERAALIVACRADRVAWTIPEWAARYGYKRAMAYKIIREGRGPKTVKIGGADRVTREADDAWRRALVEQAS